MLSDESRESNLSRGAVPQADEQQRDLYGGNSQRRGDRSPSARAEPSRTLCFDCFRLEIARRQECAEKLARAWNATQLELPISDTLDEIDRRRRRAQIAARHALGI